MTYRVEGLVDDPVAFEEGASLLLSGPTQLVTDRLYDVVGNGVTDGEAVIVIVTDGGPGSVTTALDDRAIPVAGRVGIIDCTGETAFEGDVPVRELGSPGDLTGMSLEFAKLAEEFRGGDGRIRIGLATVSTLLMYSDVRTVFRFLHVFTSRIRSADMFGAFAIDPEMHDDQTTSTVRAIFSAEARVTQSGVDLRGTGFERE